MYGALFRLIYWVIVTCACSIELSSQQPPLTSQTVESALSTELVKCPSPQALYLNYNKISSLPETISYSIARNWSCVGFSLLTTNQSLEECQSLCTNSSNCSYVFLAHNGSCSLFGGTSCNISNMNPVFDNQSVSFLPNDVVYCKERALMFLSNLADLGYLDLSFNSLISVPSSLGGLSLLTRLELSNNVISSIPSDALSSLTRLQVLNLIINNLTTVPENLFQNLSNLLQLNLVRNRLISLPDKIFSGLSRLTSLIFSINQIRALPAQVFRNLTNLEALDFGMNYISVLPDAQLFMGLTKLRTLYFDNITLTALPVEIFRGLNSLRDLRFCSNRIAQFPADLFGGLGSLSRIDACNNRLSALPKAIFWNLPLQTIRLGNNQLTSLDPDTFQGLSSLTWLDLQNNLLAILPEGIFDSTTALSILQLGRPPECLKALSSDCSGTVKVGFTIRNFFMSSTDQPTLFAPASSPTTWAPSVTPSVLAVPPVLGSRDVESDVNALTIGLICLGVALCLCCCLLFICWIGHKKRHRKSSLPADTASQVEPFDADAPENRLIHPNNVGPLFPSSLHPTLPVPAPYTKDGKQLYVERGSTPKADPPHTPGLAVPIVDSACNTTPSLTPNPVANTSWDYDSPAQNDYHQDHSFLLPEAANYDQNENSSNNPVFVKGNNKYSAFRILGKGHFGTAYLVMDPKMQVFVLKTVICTDQNEALKEAKTLSLNTPSSPHLLKILDFFFENDNLFCILMNYCRGGSLQDLITQKIHPLEVERILREMATGLEALHTTGLIHRDLKPDNIFLLDPNVRTVVIGDMGLARSLDDEGYYSSWFGHMLYKAPEIDEGKFSPRSDMWAVGCIGLELLSGEPLAARYQKYKLCLGKCSNEELQAILDQLPEGCKHYAVFKMVSALLVRDSYVRLSATQVKLFPPGDSDYSSDLVLASHRFTAWTGSPVAMHIVQSEPNGSQAFNDSNVEPSFLKENDYRIQLDFEDQASYAPRPLYADVSLGISSSAASGDVSVEWEPPIYYGENGAVGRPVLDNENGDEFLRQDKNEDRMEIRPPIHNHSDPKNIIHVLSSYNHG